MRRAHSALALLLAGTGCKQESPTECSQALELVHTLKQGDGGLAGLAAPSSATLDGQTLYVGNSDGSGLSVFAVADTGELLPGPMYAAPPTAALALAGGRLISAGPDGVVSWDLSAGPDQLAVGPLKAGATTALWGTESAVYAATAAGIERLNPSTLALEGSLTAGAGARYLDGVQQQSEGGAETLLVAASGDTLLRAVFGADGATSVSSAQLAGLDGVAISPDGGTVAATAGCDGQNVYLYTPSCEGGCAPGQVAELGPPTAVYQDAVAACPNTTDHPQWGDTVDWEEATWDAYPERAFPSALRFVDRDTLVVATRHGAAVVVLRRLEDIWVKDAIYASAAPSLLYEIGSRDYFGPFLPYADLRGQAAIAVDGARLVVTSQLQNTARLLDLATGHDTLRQAGEGGFDGLAGAYTLATDNSGWLYVAGRLDDGLAAVPLPVARGDVPATAATLGTLGGLPPCEAPCVRHQMLRVAVSHDGRTVFANDYGPPAVHALRAGGEYSSTPLASAVIPPCVAGGDAAERKPVLTDVTVAPGDRHMYVSDFQREGSTSCVWHLTWDGATLKTVGSRSDPEFAGVETLLIPKDGRSLITTSYVAGGLAVTPLDPETGALGTPTLYARPEYYGVEFMVLTRDQRTLFVTNPVQGLLLTVVRDPDSGALTLRHTVAEESGTPFLDVAGVALSPDERLLAVTNRVRGSVSLYTRDAQGNPVYATHTASPDLAFANGVVFDAGGHVFYVASAHAFTLTTWAVPCGLLEGQ